MAVRTLLPAQFVGLQESVLRSLEDLRVFLFQVAHGGALRISHHYRHQQ